MFLSLWWVACRGAAPVTIEAPEETAPTTWWEARKGHATRLTQPGPSPQPFRDVPPPDGVQRVVYQVDPELWGWFWPARRDSPLAREGRAPGVVVFHGGFAFGASDLTDLASVHEAGFALLAPTLRGENGNPGSLEMFYGEVDDAAEAVRWMARQPGVDPTRITTFGHSVGGGISALITLVPDLPLEETTSIGGLYDTEVFDVWPIPFRDGPLERRLRCFEPWATTSMQRPHHAWVGDQDLGFHAARDRLAAQSIPQLTIETVPGDHLDSYAVAIDALRERLVAREQSRAAAPR